MSDKILEITTIINQALRNDATVVSLVGFAKDKNGVDTIYPAIYNTPDVSRIQTADQHINFFISSPYEFAESVRTITVLMNCRSTSSVGAYQKSQKIAFAGAELFNREYHGSLSDRRIFFKVAGIGPSIAEDETTHNTPVTLNINSIGGDI